MRLRWLTFPILLLAGIIVMGATVGGFVVLLAYSKLPPIHALTDYRPKIPLRVYTSDGVLIGEFGEELRSFVPISQVPAVMKHAILAAEDERFYHHTGVDYLGVLRAAIANLISGGRKEGASTITMQVARDFFLSSEKTMTRKLYQALLAFKIEASLSKDKILEIYINQIYLGERAYGFAVAAQTYFGKPLSKLSAAEAAMLAGLPKAPSAYNPIANPKRARERELYVLRRMLVNGYLTHAQFVQAEHEKLKIKHGTQGYKVHAAYVAEMVRQMLHERYPHEVYTRGFRVYTTINSTDQKEAYQALRRGLLAYDHRHGYRGPEGYVNLKGAGSDEAYEEALADHPDSGDLLAALVLKATPHKVIAWHRGGETVSITGAGLKFAERMLSSKVPPNKRIRRGAIIRIKKDAKGHWQILEIPKAEAALIAVHPQDGAVRALVGGFDFYRNKFNHVTQAWRQPGSAFKPFIYSAALEKGFSPASVINDAPVVVDASQTGGQPWEPRNYEGTYEGPMFMRDALAKSKNMVSIRILQAIGPKYAQKYVTRFGFDADKVPPYLTMALGAVSVTPWQMARAYSVFANGGYRVEPYIISRIVDDRGNTLAQAQPAMAGTPSLRVISARNAFLMDSMLHDVVTHGTGKRAKSLGRQDLAGKTGTTNDYVDAWFCGYQNQLVAITWVGFDKPKRLGWHETGAVAALPIWMGFMSKALKGVPESFMPVPEDIVSARVNKEGKLSPDGTPDYFYPENLPPAANSESPQTREDVRNQLF